MRRLHEFDSGDENERCQTRCQVRVDGQHSEKERCKTRKHIETIRKPSLHRPVEVIMSLEIVHNLDDSGHEGLFGTERSHRGQAIQQSAKVGHQRA